MKKKIFAIILFLIMAGFSRITAQTDLLAGWDFTNGWVTNGANATIIDNNSFSTTSGTGIYKTGILTIGRTYEVMIEGSSTTSLEIRETVSGNLIGNDFGNHSFVASNTGIYLKNIGTGTTDITKLELYDLSPATTPSITSHPTNQSVSIGQTATFSVAATGTEPLSYQWYIDSQVIPGAIQASYITPTINDISVDGSVLYCIVSNSAGSAESNNATLYVSLPNSRVTDNLQALYNFKEGTGTLIGDESGVGSPLDLRIQNANGIKWTPEGLNINAQGRIRSDNVASKIINSSKASNEFSVEAWILPTNMSQRGEYTRIMTMGNNQGLERNIALFQNGSAYDHNVRTTSTSLNGSPTSSINNLQALTHFVFSREANGNNKIYINGNLKAESQILGDLSNWNDGYFLFLGTEVDNKYFWQGTYYQMAFYSKALSESEVIQNYNFGVESDNLPVVITHPVSQTAVVGETLSFSVSAIGTAPLSYQWKKNGTNISGANGSSYTTPILNISDNQAQFSCVVSSSDGSSESNAAQVLVFVPNERITTGIIAQYTFKEGSGTVINDVSGVGAPVNLNINSPNAVEWTTSGLKINSEANIFSSSAASKIQSMCAETDMLTVETWIKPANIQQSGPARIVTFSLDNSNRNFTLGQDGNKYEGRVRTSTTSANGLPGVSTDAGTAIAGLQHVVLRFRSDKILLIFINGVEKVRLQLTGDFSTWNNSYRLAIANEILDSNPWLGTYNYLAIFNRSVNDAEILNNYEVGPFGLEDIENPSDLSTSVVTLGSVNLNWTDNSNNEDGFVIERGSGDPITWDSIATTSANIVSFSDSTVIEGANYSYRIKAYNSFANLSSNYSNTVSILTTLNKPSSLVAKADNLGVIDLVWTDNSDNELGFIIERGTGDPLTFSVIDNTEPNILTYSDNSVDEGVEYTYRIKAFNNEAESDYSNNIMLRSKASFVLAPSNLQITLDPIYGIPVLNWTDNAYNEKGIVILRRIISAGSSYISIDTVGTDVTTFSDATVIDSTAYVYKIYAFNDEYLSEFSNETFVEVVVGVDGQNSLPEQFSLLQNYPNPFNPSTTITFNLPEASNVKLSIYNLLGQELLTIVDNMYSAGKYNVLFEAKDLTSGIYIYSIQASGNSGSQFVNSKKFILLK